MLPYGLSFPSKIKKTGTPNAPVLVTKKNTGLTVVLPLTQCSFCFSYIVKNLFDTHI
jgi:hypothetical protein